MRRLIRYIECRWSWFKYNHFGGLRKSRAYARDNPMSQEEAEDWFTWECGEGDVEEGKRAMNEVAINLMLMAIEEFRPRPFWVQLFRNVRRLCRTAWYGGYIR